MSEGDLIVVLNKIRNETGCQMMTKGELIAAMARIGHLANDAIARAERSRRELDRAA